MSDDSTISVPLPQIFFSTHGKEHYLGDYQTLQHLEDSGLLDLIISGQLCPHYRSYKGHVFYAMHSLVVQGAAKKCNTCFELENQAPIPLKLTTHHRNNKCERSHDLCSFFETNKLLFKLVDPVNDKEEVLSQSFPIIKLHGQTIKFEKLIELF